MWAYKGYGQSWDAVYKREQSPGFRWRHESLGTNWRMTEMQAAIGRVQLAKLPDWHRQRQRNAGILADALAACPALRVPVPPVEAAHAYSKFYAYVRPERLATGWSRDRIVAEVQEAGEQCAHGGCSEIYLEKAFDDTGLRPLERLSNAKMLGETSLMFRVDPTFEANDMRRLADAVSHVAQRGAG